MSNKDEDALRSAIHHAMHAAAEPLALGYSVLAKARRASGAHLTDKELFIAGAGYLFDALVAAFTQDHEPSEKDIILMSKIHNELLSFHEHFNRKLKP